MLGGLNIIALDANFEILSILSYTGLQWSRKYYESGIFSIEIPLELYDNRIKYIYSKDRPEIGIVTQRNYIVTDTYKSYNLSGYFMESELDKHVCYPIGTNTNITNSPTWTDLEGVAEDVAYDMFNGFKKVDFTDGGASYSLDLGIESGTSKSRGEVVEIDRQGNPLGKTIYSILEPSEMSYRINYNFLNNQKVFEVWKGVDRTQDNQEGNNQIVFSTRFGNIKQPNILIDETEYKSAYIAHANKDNVPFVHARTFERNNPSVVFVKSSANSNDYKTNDKFIKAMHAEGINTLANYTVKINVEFDAMEGSYKYREDFDLGDKCSIEVPEIGLSADAVLIGCYEVIRRGVNTLSLEFGTPVLK